MSAAFIVVIYIGGSRYIGFSPSNTEQFFNWVVFISFVSMFLTSFALSGDKPINNKRKVIEVALIWVFSWIIIVILSSFFYEKTLFTLTNDGVITLDSLKFERGWLFFLLGASGVMVVTTISALILHVSNSQQSETDLRIAATAFESHEGMMITDADERILRVNKAFSEITGYNLEEVIGLKPSIFKSSHHDDDFFCQIQSDLRESGAWQGEVWNKRKDGEEYPSWLTITAVKNKTNEITHYVGGIEDISQKKARDNEIHNLAFYDSLTNLPNRRLLTDRLSHAMLSSDRSRCIGALLFIDLDNFKMLNDTMGHDKGDELLKQVAVRLNRSVRDGDSIARFGGDEFVVVLEGLGRNYHEASAGARTICDRILGEISRPFDIGGYNHHSSGSIGLTLFRGNEQSIDELMKQADLAMYQAKAAGKNAMRFFDQDMQTSINERANLEKDMRESIRDEGFEIYYQPQVDAHGHIIGAEALLRWNHYKKGFIPTGDFIRLAEETGLIIPLGGWVIEKACRQLAKWSQLEYMRGISLSVNVSAMQFRHKNFIGFVSNCIKNHEVDTGKLKIEITESMLLDDVDEMISKMSLIKETGVSFSLDDFGTGYSSLAYLKKLPLDQLKIDQSFVKDVTIDQNDASIARAIITLAKNLDMTVIAEGVETNEQKNFLSEEGCPLFQGYLFGRPEPVAVFERAVKMNRQAHGDRLPSETPA